MSGHPSQPQQALDGYIVGASIPTSDPRFKCRSRDNLNNSNSNGNFKQFLHFIVTTTGMSSNPWCQVSVIDLSGGHNNQLTGFQPARSVTLLISSWAHPTLSFTAHSWHLPEVLCLWPVSHFKRELRDLQTWKDIFTVTILLWTSTGAPSRCASNLEWKLMREVV